MTYLIYVLCPFCALVRYVVHGQVCCTLVRLLYTVKVCGTLVSFVVHWSGLLYTGQVCCTLVRFCCTLVRFVVHWSGLLYTCQVCSTLVRVFVNWSGLSYTGQICCTLVRFVVHHSRFLYTVQVCCIHWSGLLYTMQGFCTLVRWLYTGQVCCTLVRVEVHWSGLKYTGQGWSTLVRCAVHWSGLKYTGQGWSTFVRLYTGQGFCTQLQFIEHFCQNVAGVAGQILSKYFVLDLDFRCSAVKNIYLLILSLFRITSTASVCVHSYVSVQQYIPHPATNWHTWHVQMRVTYILYCTHPIYTPILLPSPFSSHNTLLFFKVSGFFWGFSFWNVPIYMYAVLICTCPLNKNMELSNVEDISTESKIFYNCAVWTNISEVEYRAIKGQRKQIMLCW